MSPWYPEDAAARGAAAALARVGVTWPELPCSGGKPQAERGDNLFSFVLHVLRQIRLVPGIQDAMEELQNASILESRCG